MGAEDVRRQGLNVFRIQMLGAKVSLIFLVRVAYSEIIFLGRTCALWLENLEGCRE